VENQILLCRQYIAAHFGGEEAENALVYEDEGFSGGNLDRPKFRRMMEDCRKGMISAVVVYRLDRISRNIGDFAGLIEDLGSLGIGFISIREQFDTSSPMGRAMMYIASVFSQLERETIAERIRDNMRELAKTGRWLGGITPMGYESESVEDITEDGKTKKAYRLKTVPEEISIVKMIFDCFMETGSLTEVERHLQKKHALTRQGNPFTRFSIRGILENPVYMIADEEAYRYFAERTELSAPISAFDGTHGIMAYNRTYQKHGKAHRINPVHEWIVAAGSHDGVISGGIWVKVQEKLGENRVGKCRRSRKSPALLSGILYCGCCGEKMRPKLTDRTTADGEMVYTYLCTGKERSHGQKCTVKNADGNMIDGLILSEIGKMETDLSELRQWMRKETGRTHAEESDTESLRQQIAQYHERIRNLTKSLADAKETSVERYILEQIGEYHKTAEHFEEELAERERILLDSSGSAESEHLRERLENFGTVLLDLSTEEKRCAVRAFTGKIVWDGENAHLYPGCFEEPECEDSK